MQRGGKEGHRVKESSKGVEHCHHRAGDPGCHSGAAPGGRAAGRSAADVRPVRQHGADVSHRLADLVKPCAPEDVQVGDAITFVLNEDLDVVTHRVISIDAENEHFYTQGDANDAPDGAPVYFKNLIGRPVFTIPYLGYVSHWVSNPPGMYLAIALALVLIILTFLPDMLRKASEADARDAARRAQADKPGDAPDAKNSGENMGK